MTDRRVTKSNANRRLKPGDRTLIETVGFGTVHAHLRGGPEVLRIDARGRLYVRGSSQPFGWDDLRGCWGRSEFGTGETTFLYARSRANLLRQRETERRVEAEARFKRVSITDIPTDLLIACVDAAIAKREKDERALAAHARRLSETARWEKAP